MKKSLPALRAEVLRASRNFDAVLIMDPLDLIFVTGGNVGTPGEDSQYAAHGGLDAPVFVPGGYAAKTPQGGVFFPCWTGLSLVRLIG